MLREINVLNISILAMCIFFRCTPSEKTEQNSVEPQNKLNVSTPVNDSMNYVTIKDTIIYFMDTNYVDTIVRLDDGSYFLFLSLAQNAIRHHKYDLYKSYLQYMERIHPWDAFIYNSLGFASQREGNEKEAMRYFRRALAMADSMIISSEARGDQETTYFYELQKANAVKMALSSDSSSEIIQSLIEKYPESFIADDLKIIKNMNKDELLKDMN